MTADEYLAANDKRPFTPNPDDDQALWYWGHADDPGAEPEDADMLLPRGLYDLLPGRQTYPECKAYRTEEEALNACRAAYDRSA